MIINVRGTGGSGKSTIIRRVMQHYVKKEPVRIEDRKQPYGYTLEWDSTALRKPLYVVGHYETPCGGGDTITNVSAVFESVRERATEGYDVLFEGIISQDDTTRTIELHRSFPLLVIFLNTPLAECLKGIQLRRDERGDERTLNPKNTESRMKRCQSHYSKLRDAGVECLKLDREAAYLEVRKRLNV